MGRTEPGILEPQAWKSPVYPVCYLPHHGFIFLNILFTIILGTERNREGRGRDRPLQHSFTTFEVFLLTGGDWGVEPEFF